MLPFLAQQYKKMRKLLDYKTNDIVDISTWAFFTPTLMPSYEKFKKNTNYTYLCICIHTQAQMYEVDAPPVSNENKCVSCYKYSNIKLNIFELWHIKRMCASLWRKQNKNLEIIFISILSYLFHYETTYGEMRGMSSLLGRFAINKPNPMCGQLLFEIYVIHTSSNCTCKQQHNIRKNDNNFMRG